MTNKPVKPDIDIQDVYERFMRRIADKTPDGDVDLKALLFFDQLVKPYTGKAASND